MTRILLILLCVIPFISGYSQDKQLLFKHLSTSDGLSHNWVRTIYMDDSGFMWFGTADGLNKYNGNEFKVYRPKTKKGNSIGNVNISDIKKKDSVELWICSDLGVYTYNSVTDQLLPFTILNSIAVLCMLEDKQNNLWFGTSRGLYYYNTTNQKTTIYLKDKSDSLSISSNYVNSIFEDSQSNIWIGTKNGLNLFNRSNNKFTNYIPDNSGKISFSNDLMSICEDKDHKIWLGYAQNGLYCIDYIQTHQIDFKKVIDGNIISLLIDKQNQLWVCKGSGGGIEKINLNSLSDKEKDILFNIKSINNVNSNLSDNSVFSIFQDKFDDIWVGTFGDGINYYSPRAKKFNIVNSFTEISKKGNILINAILEDENNIYIGTEGGFVLYEKTTQKYTLFQNENDNNSSLSANPIYAIFKDSRNNIWLGTWSGGLNLFDTKTKTFKHFLPDGKEGSLSNANVFSILEDKKGNLWIGTIGGGLNLFNYKTKTFKCYRHSESDSNSIYNDQVNHIYETSDGSLYISVYNSLEQYDYENDIFIHYKHDFANPNGNFGNIQSIFEDSKKNLWLATNSGLEYFDRAAQKYVTYTTSNGLPDNTIQGILEDDNGNLWISTNFGLSKFINGTTHPDKPIFYNYTIDDGLSGNEFKNRSTFKNEKGILYFGSSQGFTYFHPDSIKINPTPPQVILSFFSLLNSKEDDIDSNLLFRKKHINFTDQIDLPYANSDFVIGFAALNYLNPQNNKFRYKLSGYDSNWIDATSQQSATYTNLNPGKYTFMVMASNNDNVWSNTPKSITIVIHPPWWKTRIFKIATVLLIIIILLSIYMFRVRILQRQKTELENIVSFRTQELRESNKLLEIKQEEIQKQFEELSVYKNNLESLVLQRTEELNASKDKAEESDRLKTAFLQNMSHEIRTPLNAIMGFSSLLDFYFDDKTKLVEFTNIIKQKSEDLIGIIDEILDISKIESGLLKVNLSNCNIRNCLMEIEKFYLEYRKRLNKEHIDVILKNDLGKNFSNIIVDKGKLKQIIENLIGNAFKFTEKGYIELGCSIYDDNTLLFNVSDTGIGIEEDNQKVIFERFRQVGEMTFREGTGLGLSISKGLVELLGGKIWVKSEINKGSTFFFTIPYKAQEDSETKENSENLNSDSSHKKSVIIAEKDYLSFIFFKELIKELDFRIIYVDNGIQLINELERNTPDLILLDINMTGHYGDTCMDVIKDMRVRSKIIIHSEEKLSDENKIHHKEGKIEYISKPIKKIELLKLIEKVMSNKTQ